MRKHTNMYYSQFADTSESEPGYDSDSPEAARALRSMSSRRKFYQLIDKRERDEKLHSQWIEMIDSEDNSNVARKAESESGMSVFLSYERVTYKCYLKIGGRNIKAFPLKIKINYAPISRSWYFAEGISLVPSIINFSVLPRNFTDPLSRNIIKEIVRIREIVQDHQLRQHYFHSFIAKVENDYLDARVKLDENMENLSITISDKAWPLGVPRTDFRDTIELRFKFDETPSIVSANCTFYNDNENGLPNDWRKSTESVKKKLSSALAGNPTIEKVFVSLMGRELEGNRYEFNDLRLYR